jgi:hypothetical protein
MVRSLTWWRDSRHSRAEAVQPNDRAASSSCSTSAELTGAMGAPWLRAPDDRRWIVRPTQAAGLGLRGRQLPAHQTYQGPSDDSSPEATDAAGLNLT